MDKEFEFPLDLAEKCVKCGLCKSVCPTYPFKEEEGAFARGRLALAEMVIKGEIPLTREVVAQWNECAMCRRCEWICPNDVQYKEILTHARELQHKQMGKDFISEAGLKSLEFMQSKVGRITLKIAGILSKPLPKEIKLPLPTGGVKFFPKPYGKPFGIRGKTFKAEKEKKKLLFFTGCMIDVFYGKTGESVIKVLNKLGYTVIVPKDIKCCGAPHLYHGNIEAFEKLKEHNLREMEKYKYDAIVVACPTCGGALKEDYGKSWEVLSFTEIIAKEDAKFKGDGESVTVHVPCHYYTAMKLNPNNFYQALGKVEGAKTIKAEKSQSCCGFAGLFSIKNPKLSEEIQREKMLDFKKTGANYIVTECPGCVLQLRDGTKKFRNNQEVKHIADYLAERIT
ncbi:MAG TPA: (Fe-S)-binding protein [Aquifex aeolicus]|nr:(Fe-S)-binding protein [Aquifex aeolicus]